MDKKEFYNMINRVIGDKVFQYEGPIMGGVSLDVVIDFKFKIVGDVKLLHMGEPKNHVSIDVTVLSITPPTLDGFIQNLDNAFEIKDRMYFTATKIENYIWRVLQHFSIEDTPVITSIKFTGKRYEYMEKINEGISEKKGIVRKVVQDIIRVFKKGEGEYALPEDISNNMTYDFPNLNTEFTVEVKIDEDNTIEGFDIDGGYYDDEETFEIHIQYNPKFFPETYYDLIGELNEIVRHELQHLIQSERGINRPTDETDPEKYYLQPHELDAQIAGFKRLSKIRKEPFEKTVINWFNTNKTLGDDAKERIINVILKTKKWPQ
jgi:hypothetical protein